MHLYLLLADPLLVIILAYLAILWRQKVVAKRVVDKAMRELLAATPRERKAYLWQADISPEEFRKLHPHDKLRVRQSLWLNIMAIDEAKRLGPYRIRVKMLELSAGLGG